MSLPPADHPPVELLSAFALGGLSGADATAVEEHLSRCSTCCDLLSHKKDDALVRLVRTSVGGKPTDVAALRLQPGYEILGELGRGGMGVVYKARQAGLNRVVALKRARADGGAEEFVRFRREAEAAARLRHPNIVQIFEVGEQDGLPYLAMEYVEGGTLADRLGGTPVPPRVAAGLVAAVAGAIEHAHQNGVVHRDLKPENVLLTFSREPPASAPAIRARIGEWGSPTHTAGALAGGSLNGAVPMVADFGLAKLLDQADWKTKTGALLGTPKYMAPEQAAASNQVGPTTDVHALGVLLYEMLTGRVPYAGATMLETLEQVCAHDPAPPRRLQPGVPRELETVCLKALAKEPPQRYSSAAAMAEDLARYLDGRPILARPAGPVERTYKAIRRRPARATLVALAGLMVLGSIGGVGYHNAQLRAEVERTEEESARVVRERDRADAQYRDAQQTLARMLAATRTQPTGALHTTMDVRRIQQEIALAFFERAVAGQDDPDPWLLEDLAASLTETARLQIARGKGADAEKNLRRAIRLWEQLDIEAGGDRDRRSDLATCFSYLGVLLLEQPDRREEAVACGNKAVEVLERLVRDFPAESYLKYNLAQSSNNLASTIRSQSPAPALRLYERSQALYRELHKAQPDSVGFAVSRAESGINLGSLHAEMGQHDKAAPPYQESLKILAPLAAANPGHNWYASSLAALRINLGELDLARSRPREALQQLDLAVLGIQGILAREPGTKSHEHLAEAHDVRARALSQLGRHADSLKEWDRAVEWALEAQRPAYRLKRAGGLIQVGELNRAAAEADDVAGAAKAEAVSLFVAGQLHARIASAVAGKPSEAESHAARAVGWLEKARAAGYFTADRALLKQDDFAALWPRADFQKLRRAITNASTKGKK